MPGAVRTSHIAVGVPVLLSGGLAHAHERTVEGVVVRAPPRHDLPRGVPVEERRCSRHDDDERLNKRERKRIVRAARWRLRWAERRQWRERQERREEAGEAAVGCERRNGLRRVQCDASHAAPATMTTTTTMTGAKE